MSAFDGMPGGAPSNGWQAQEFTVQLSKTLTGHTVQSRKRFRYETLEALEAIASA
jgi:hypothetical protein